MDVTRWPPSPLGVPMAPGCPPLPGGRRVSGRPPSLLFLDRVGSPYAQALEPGRFHPPYQQPPRTSGSEYPGHGEDGHHDQGEPDLGQGSQENPQPGSETHVGGPR